MGWQLLFLGHIFLLDVNKVGEKMLFFRLHPDSFHTVVVIELNSLPHLLFSLLVRGAADATSQNPRPARIVLVPLLVTSSSILSGALSDLNIWP